MTAGAKAGEALSSGVDELIARLREEGVDEGRREAERLLAEARAEARRIVDRADAEAREKRERARRDAESLRQAGEEALRTAIRDTILTMKTNLMESFRADVQRLVSHQMSDPDLLRQLVLEVAGRVRDTAGLGEAAQIEVVLPASVAGLEDLRRDPEELEKGELTRFVFGLTSEMLREGVTFSADGDLSGGVKVHVSERDVTLDLSDRAVAALLLQHLQPRFRAILEGVVR